MSSKKPIKKDISCVTSDYLCLSCGACSVTCKHGSIFYHETVGGFLFPQIDQKSCIHCGLCYDVCPGVHFNNSLINQMPADPFTGDILSCEVGTATEKAIFQNSQSGGIATALMTHLFEKEQIRGAIVATMQNAPPRGKAILARSSDELILAQKSKYIPIPMLSVLADWNSIEGPVAFVGLPCQIHGLNNLFDRFPDLESKIFIKIGLICDRIQTNAVIDYFSHKAGKQSITNLTFRDKNEPTYPGNLVVTDENGEKRVFDASSRMEIKDFFTPPRCRLCFDKLNVYADIVVGDPHGIMGIDRTCGESLVFTRTKKGKNAFINAKNDGFIETRFVNAQNAINGQQIFRKQLLWSNYIHAWQKMGRKLPDFPKRILIIAENKKDANKKYTVDLFTGLSLDRFPSRSAVIDAAEWWLFRRKIIILLIWPVSSLKILINRIIENENKL